MNILIFYQYFGTPNGSWSTRIYEFSKRWIIAGHKVTVVTAPYEKSDIKTNRFIDKRTIEGINLIVINAPDSNRSSLIKRAFNSILFSIVASWYALIHKSDIIISSSGPITIAIPGLIAKNLKKTPFIFEIRDLWPGGAIEMRKINNAFLIKASLFFEKYIYKKADLLVTCSDGQEDNILSRFPQINSVTIPHGGDIDLFQQIDDNETLKSETKIFLHIGSLGYIHNCKLILDAAEYIKSINKDLDIKIVFIGDGAEKNELVEMKIKNGLTNVEFIGLLPKIELPKWLWKSRATIFTTLNNETQNTSCPNKIFDSFAAGKPIIQTTTGWIKTLIDKEQCGINVEPENAKELADAIILIAKDDIKHSQMSLNASRLANTLFNRNILAKQYLDVMIGIYIKKNLKN